MAKCERCGASFDYEEREGVCPRCCFYNRPPGAARQDTEWMKYYNVEDNSYQLPKSEGLADLFPEEKTGWASRLRKNRRTAQTDRRERSARRNDGTDSGRSRRERKQRQAASRTADTSEETPPATDGQLPERIGRKVRTAVCPVWERLSVSSFSCASFSLP